ncbi:hypothetical protein NOVO_02125 [Rickettsiales bacterium Ac37b]|nr:hypothetical protein NOVO_02125 [Rickettsiales bacterium Ac37b]
MLNQNQSMLNDSEKLMEKVREISPKILPADMSIEDKLIYILKEACEEQDIKTINALWNLKEVFIRRLFDDEYKDIFIKALDKEKENVLEALLNLEMYICQHRRILQSGDNYIFRTLAAKGYLEIIKKITKDLDSYDIREMVSAKNYEAFRAAAYHGHIAVLEFLLELAPALLPEAMIYAVGKAFRFAAENAHIAVLEFLLNRTPVFQREAMMHCKVDDTFRGAAFKGHIKVLELLVKSIPDSKKQKEMICSNNDEIFHRNITSKPIMQFLLSLVPEKWKTIKEDNFSYYYSSKILENSIEFIQKLSKVPIEFPQIAISTILNMQKFASKIYNFILSSKTIMMLLAEPAMNSMLCALDDTKSDLLEYDRRCVVKAMQTISNDNEPKPEVCFVDKILKEKFPEKIDNLLLSK